MAAFKDKKNGTWYVQFRYTDWQCERQQKLKRGFATKHEAQEWEREFLMQKKSDPNMTFESFYKMYENDVKPRLKLNTWLSKESIIKDKILPYFSKQKMSEITAKDVIEWQNTIRQLKDKQGNPTCPPTSRLYIISFLLCSITQSSITACQVILRQRLEIWAKRSIRVFMKTLCRLERKMIRV